MREVSGLKMEPCGAPVTATRGKWTQKIHNSIKAVRNTKFNGVKLIIHEFDQQNGSKLITFLIFNSESLINSVSTAPHFLNQFSI